MSTPELFKTPPFLEQKLDTKLFEKIPQSPGIYRFYDADEILLYVGKAKNLRRRLFTYKRAKPGRTSRKEAALISNIHRLEYDVLNSEQEAILHENRWIRERRPEFNHANKHTETYYFVTIQQHSSGLLFGLSMNPSGNLFPQKEKPLYQEMVSSFPEGGDAKVYGCFKGHRQVRISLGALLQLLWIAEHRSVSPHFLPVQLSRNLTPMRFKLPLQNQSSIHPDELIIMLDHWFFGLSPDLLHYLEESVHGMEKSPFTQHYIEECVDTLLTYFHRSLERHRVIRELRSNQKSHLIQQDELDDLITRFNNNQPQLTTPKGQTTNH